MEAERAVVPRGEQAPELVARRPHAHDELVAPGCTVDNDALFPVADLVRGRGTGRVRGRVRAGVRVKG